MFNDLTRPSASPRAPPPPYLTHTFPSTPVHRLAFQPFTDQLGVGHAKGLATLVVPGAGEANLDSRAANPYETKRGRREREVHALLDKIPADLITLDPDALGRVDKKVLRAVDDENPHKPGFKPTPFAKRTRAERLALTGAHAADEDEDSASEDDDDPEGTRRQERAQRRIDKSDEKKRMRGKSSGIKKALRKRRRNVIDPQTVRSLSLSLSFSVSACSGLGDGDADPRRCRARRSPSRRSSSGSARRARRPRRHGLRRQRARQGTVGRWIGSAAAVSRGAACKLGRRAPCSCGMRFLRFLSLARSSLSLDARLYRHLCDGVLMSSVPVDDEQPFQRSTMSACSSRSGLAFIREGAEGAARVDLSRSAGDRRTGGADEEADRRRRAQAADRELRGS